MDNEARILLVDDEANLLRSMEKSLFREGFDVETADGNPAAMVLFEMARQENNPFDLVIVDLNMPDFSGKESRYAGLELLEQLKKVAPEMPVMVNSAWDEVETAKLCIDKGADDYFVKGRTNEMLSKIQNLLGRS